MAEPSDKNADPAERSRFVSDRAGDFQLDDQAAEGEAFDLSPLPPAEA